MSPLSAYVQNNYLHWILKALLLYFIQRYKLIVGGYSGDVRDSLIEMTFMTKHRNNNVVSGNCTVSYKRA